MLKNLESTKLAIFIGTLAGVLINWITTYLRVTMGFISFGIDTIFAILIAKTVHPVKFF